MMVVLSGASIALPEIAKSYLYDQLDDQATLYLDDLSAYVDISPDGTLSLQAEPSDPRFQKPYSGWYWQINAGDNQLRSRSLWDIQQDLNTLIDDGDELLHSDRSLTLGSHPTPITIVVGIDTHETNLALHNLTTTLLTALGAIAFCMLALLVFQIRWTMKPMQQLQEDLGSVRSGESEKLKGHYPDEVQPAVDDLNVLLFQYNRLLQRARTHTGNLAHALKTPLAIIRNQTATLPESQQIVFESAAEQLQERMNYHLGRARMAGSTNVLGVMSCPADMVDRITTAFERAYAARDIVLVNELDDEQKVIVDKLDLEEMLGNLIENAFKWASSLIRVYAEKDAQMLHIFIEDDGPGLPTDKFETVLQRGVRFDECTPGSGLGLSIVLDIAHSYHGQLYLQRGTMKGLCAVLTLPLAR